MQRIILILHLYWWFRATFTRMRTLERDRVTWVQRQYVISSSCGTKAVARIFLDAVSVFLRASIRSRIARGIANPMIISAVILARVLPQVIYDCLLKLRKQLYRNSARIVCISVLDTQSVDSYSHCSKTSCRPTAILELFLEILKYWVFIGQSLDTIYAKCSFKELKDHVDVGYLV